VEVFTQVFISGLAVGGIYALVALGYTIIYRSLYVINFAQGHVFMIGSFMGFLAFTILPVLPPVVFVLVLIVSAIVGMITVYFVFSRIHKSDHLYFAIASIGVGFIYENIVRMLCPDTKKYPDIFGETIYSLAGIHISKQYIWIISITLILVVLLQLFFYKTKMGKALRAVSEDRDMGSLLGINVNLMVYIAFAISYIVGAIGGVLIGPIYFFSFDMGLMVSLKAFSAAILGGITSIQGTIIGGLILGISENLGALYISSDYKDAIAFILLIFMLMYRPRGIMGKKG
jgi:branched-chain amino acid transport system permease protein